MNLTDSDTLKFLKGTPILLDDICAIFPATLGQIVDEGYDKFEQYLGVLTATKPSTTHDKDDELTQLMSQLTDFQYILMLSTLDSHVNETMKAAFQFFTHENAIFSLDPPQIILGPLEEKHILNEEKFYDFQRILRRMYFLEVEGEEIIIYEDDLPSVRRLKEKMRQNREKVRRAKAKQNGNKSDAPFVLAFSSFFALSNISFHISLLYLISFKDKSYFKFCLIAKHLYL